MTKGATSTSGGADAGIGAGEAVGGVASCAAKGAAYGSVVPVFGTIAGAIGGALKGMGCAIRRATSDTFHPTKEWARSVVTVIDLAPGMLFGGFDAIKRNTDNAPDDAARLYRFLLRIGGIVGGPKEIKHNPRDVKSPTDPEFDPYVDASAPDPRFPLTNRDLTRHVLDLTNAAGGDLTSPTIPSMLKTPAEARRALGHLRSSEFGGSGVLATDMMKAAAPGFREAVARARALAGEEGADHKLAALLGGDVSVPPRRGDPKMRGAPGGAPDSPDPSAWTTEEKAAAGIVGAGALAVLAAWLHRRARKSR